MAFQHYVKAFTILVGSFCLSAFAVTLPIDPLANLINCKEPRYCAEEHQHLTRDVLAIYRFVDHGRYEARELILCRDGRVQIGFDRLRYIARFGIQRQLSKKKLQQIQEQLGAVPEEYKTRFGMPLGVTKQSYSYLLRPSPSKPSRLSSIFIDGVDDSPPPPAEYLKVYETLHSLMTDEAITTAKAVRIVPVAVTPRDKSIVFGGTTQPWPFEQDFPLTSLVKRKLSSTEWKKLKTQLMKPEKGGFDNLIFLEGKSLDISGPISLNVLLDVSEPRYFCSENPW